MREINVEYATDWAQVDSTGKVVNVISAMREQIASRIGDGFVYVESSDERTALMGGKYFADTDTFSIATPFDSWVWDNDLRTWQPPTPKPNDDTWTQTFLDGFETERELWVWNETDLEWQRTDGQ